MKFLKRVARRLAALVPTLLLLLGAAAVSYGVAMIYVPAGVICGGALAITGGVLMVRGGDVP